MKRAIQAKNDFTEECLPHNRWQLFGELLRYRFGFLMKAGLLTALFFLPFLAWNIYMLEECRLLSDGATDATAYETAVQLLALTNTKNLVNVILLGVGGIGVSGGVYVLQKCAWGEIIFISDFFAGLKRDWLKNFLCRAIVGLSRWLLEYAIRFVPISTLSSFAAVLMYGVASVQLVLVSVMAAFSVCQNTIYRLSVLQLFKNSFAFAFKGLFPMLGILLCGISPAALLLVNNMIADIAAAVMFSVMLGGSLTAMILYADSLFDRFINREHYPQLVDKNLKRMPKKRK